jgi:hypothetical protein
MEEAVIMIYALALLLYFTPTWVASARAHPNFAGVLVINLFLGWTFVGWVASLAWAVSGPRGDGRSALEKWEGKQ